MSDASPSNSPISALPKKVLIAVDLSPASDHAIAFARGMVAPGGSVRLVSVAENPRTLVPTGKLAGSALDSARAELLSDAKDALTIARTAFDGREVNVEALAIDLSRAGGDVVHALTEAAHDWPADLLVVGARQHHGLRRWVEGAVSTPLLKHAPCPVLVVPAGFTATKNDLPKRVLFAVDGSPHATAALHYGLRFATHETALRAVYVVDRAVRLSDFVPIDALEDAFVEEGTRALAAARPILANTSEHASATLVETERTSDDVAHAIVRAAAAWNAELIVMGTHGRRGVSRWLLGSVAERVARLTQTPLLLVNVQGVSR
jgi:nucleotide-binding universal stress UspA family protein